MSGESSSAILSEALDAYAQACRQGSDVQPQKLNFLVDLLVDNWCTKNVNYVQEHIKSESLDMFSCSFCQSILYEPTTLNCGHTFCKSCFLKQDSNRTCKMCNQYHKPDDNILVKVDFLLCGQLNKYFTSAYKAAKLRLEGNLKYEEGDYTEAMKLYSEASQLAPLDHVIASNKSLVFSAQKEYSEAIREADTTCQVKPHWPTGYFRKGYAQMLAGRYEDALVSILQCLSLDSSIAKAKALLAKVLQKMLSPSPTPETLKCAESQTCFVLGGRVPRISIPISIFSTRLNDLASAISMGFKKSEGRRGVGSRTAGHSYSIEVKISSSTQVVTSNTDKTSDEDASKDRVDAGELQKKRKHSGHSSREESPSMSHENTFTYTEVKHEPRVIPKDLLNLSDYECSLCFRLLLEPATTPCGHTFCMGCLNRCLDHKPQCPLCKESLTEFLATEKRSINMLITNILNRYFEKEFLERAETHAKEMEELRGATGDQEESIIPVFICTIAYPTIPCPLHIFEPRYKLMIRQCMESGSKQFGMCIPSDQHEFSDIGCMLNILEVQALPNGRSAIRTVGARRFKVLNRSMRDGYNTAKVAFIQDETIQEDEIDQIKTLHESVHAEAKEWFKCQLPRIRSTITQHYGWIPALPESLTETPEGPVWTWWLLAILPIQQRAQLECMALTTIKDRLLYLQRCLEAIKNK